VADRRLDHRRVDAHLSAAGHLPPSRERHDPIEHRLQHLAVE
jgi:hypothetical protein